MAYASATSPFASVKGENVFRKSPSPSPSPFLSTPSAANANGPPLTPPAMFSSSSDFGSLTAKRTGFESFAGSASPFAAFARGKSPLLNANMNAFSAYALGGAQGFSVSSSSTPALAPKTSKKVKEGSTGSSGEDATDDDGAVAEENGTNGNGIEKNGSSASFGDKLRAQEEEETCEEKKLQLTEQESTFLFHLRFIPWVLIFFQKIRVKRKKRRCIKFEGNYLC